MTSATSGLSPVRQVLPNGGVVIVQETQFSPAVTIAMSLPRRQPQQSRRPDRPRVVPGARDRSRHHHASAERSRKRSTIAAWR